MVALPLVNGNIMITVSRTLSSVRLLTLTRADGSANISCQLPSYDT